jgi:hypothetical protein
MAVLETNYFLQSTTHKHLVIGFCKANKHGRAMMDAFSEVATMVVFGVIRFVVHDSSSDRDNYNNEVRT